MKSSHFEYNFFSLTYSPNAYIAHFSNCASPAAAPTFSQPSKGVDLGEVRKGGENAKVKSLMQPRNPPGVVVSRLIPVFATGFLKRHWGQHDQSKTLLKFNQNNLFTQYLFLFFVFF